MFDGYLNFASDEIVNVARLKAYVKAGLAPAGASVEVCEDCDSLPIGLGDDAYSTPINDKAPWYDTSDPDSWEFAGVMPLEITGLSGSTRTAQPVPLSRDGSAAGRVRYDGRTVAVTAVLVGRTGCAVESGLNWLSTVLAGTSCGPGSGGCSVDDLCALTCCPSIDEVEDITEPIQPWPDALGPHTWSGIDGRWMAADNKFIPYQQAVTPANRVNLVRTPLGPTATGVPANWRAGSLQPAVIRVNYCPNPQPTSLTGWSAAGATLVAAPWDAARQAVSRPGNGTSANYVLTPVMPAADVISAGQQVTVRAKVKCSNPARQFYVGVHSRSPNVYGNKTANITAGDDWQDIVYNGPAGIDIVAGQFDVVVMQVGIAPVTETLIVGDICVEVAGPATPQPYFDGSTPAAGLLTQTWVGTPNASISRQSMAQFAPTDPVTANGVGDGVRMTLGTNPGWTGTMAPYVEPVPPVATAVNGQQYAAKVQVRSNTGLPMQVALSFVPVGGGAPLVYRTAPRNVYDSLWSDLEVVATAPATGDYTIAVGVGITSPTARVVGTWVDTRRWQINQAAPAGAFFDGDTPDTADWNYAWTGAANGSTSTATYLGAPAAVLDPRLEGPVEECWKEARVVWKVSTTEGPSRMSYGAKDAETGEVLYRSTTTTVSGNRTLTMTVDPAWTNWVPVLWSSAPILMTAAFWHRPLLNPQDCLDDVTRTYMDVTTIAGPTVVEKIPFACGEYLLKVEWTWLVGNPFTAMQSTLLAAGAPSHSAADPKYMAFGVVKGSPGYMVPEVCDETTQPIPLSVVDPCCPGFKTPPAPPQLVDPCLVIPYHYWRTEILVPSTFAPQNTRGTFTVTIHNDHHPKRGLRVRVYPDPLQLGVEALDECSGFCEEFFVTYIPGDAVFVIDGVHGRIQTFPKGQTAPVNTAASVRGLNGGPFNFPVVECSTPYSIVVDAPWNYRSDCSYDPKVNVPDPEQGHFTYDIVMTPMVA